MSPRPREETGASEASLSMLFSVYLDVLVIFWTAPLPSIGFLLLLLLLFNYSCLHFLLSPPRPQTNPASTLPLGFVHVSFTVVPENSSPCCPLPTLVIVRLFLTSMSLVIICLLFSFDYVPVKGEIIWYLSLTAWLISFSIMLSSSIHAVAKGISLFFLSAA